MCEWTPPWETSPSRWTFSPRSKAPRSASFSNSSPDSIALFTRTRSWKRMRPEPIVRWPTSEFPIWPSGRPTAGPDASSCACGKSRHRRSKTGVSASSIALPGPGRRDSPAVEDDERYEGIRAAVSHIALKESTSSDAPPTRAPSTSGCASSAPALSGLTEPP